MHDATIERPMTRAEARRMQLRTGLFQRRGLDEGQAQELAQRCLLRDRDPVRRPALVH